MRDQSAILTGTEDPALGTTRDEIVGYGEVFPSNVDDGFLFTLIKDERKMKYVWDLTNGVWRSVGNDSNSNLDVVPDQN